MKKLLDLNRSTNATVMTFVNIFCLALIIANCSTVKSENKAVATSSREDKCQLPDCLRMSTSPPNNLSPNEIPQLVFLTFDDAITQLNFINYTTITRDRVNPNGCPVSLTFYINHEYNDYKLSHDLFIAGHELNSHSVTKLSNQTYWAQASTETMLKEIGQMRDMLSLYANVPIDDIKGYRAPFLRTSGSYTYAALSQLGMFDHSMPTRLFMDPPLYPYTLDFGSAQDCDIPPCINETDSFPGTWVVPMVDVLDKNGATCAMADSCTSNPKNAAETMNFLRENFQRHYTSNKAPFGIYLHAAWFQAFPYTLTGYLQFLNYLSTLQDVYIVSVGKGMEWMKNPGTLSQAASQFHCPPLEPLTCKQQTCYYNQTETPVAGERFMTICGDCPPFYPWLDNPYGQIGPEMKSSGN